MLVTLSGIVTVVKPVHPENAEDPTLVTLEGIVIEVKTLQYANAYLSMLVTLSGIVTEVKPLQPENAYSPMLVPDVIVTENDEDEHSFATTEVISTLPIIEVKPLQ